MSLMRELGEEILVQKVASRLMLEAEARAAGYLDGGPDDPAKLASLMAISDDMLKTAGGATELLERLLSFGAKGVSTVQRAGDLIHYLPQIPGVLKEFGPFYQRYMQMAGRVAPNSTMAQRWGRMVGTKQFGNMMGRLQTAVGKVSGSVMGNFNAEAQAAINAAEQATRQANKIRNYALGGAGVAGLYGLWATNRANQAEAQARAMANARGY